MELCIYKHSPMTNDMNSGTAVKKKKGAGGHVGGLCELFIMSAERG